MPRLSGCIAIVAAPKYRFETRRTQPWVRPWIVPVGIEFIINSPPSDDSTYLDIGIPFGASIDFLLNDRISVGIDWRYHLTFNRTNVRSGTFTTVGGYIGLNF